MLIYLRSFVSKHLTCEKFLRNKTNRVSLVHTEYRCLGFSHYKFNDNKKDSDEKLVDSTHKQPKQFTPKTLRNFTFVNYEKQIVTPVKLNKQANITKLAEKSDRKYSKNNDTNFEFNQEESVSIKLAKLIDKLNTENVEKNLMEPIKIVNMKNFKKTKNDTRHVSNEKTNKLHEILRKLDPKVEEISKTKSKNQTKSEKIEQNISTKIKEEKHHKKEFNSKSNVKQKLQVKIKNETDTPTQSSPLPNKEYAKSESNQKIAKLSVNDLIDINYPEATSDILKTGKGLSIFTQLKENALPCEPRVTLESPVWTNYDHLELKLLFESPSTNGFDEMIKLTNEGKVWKFPIDNEQEIEEAEANISFDQHVFLDGYLEEFPQLEPIQQFMTLVLNGISLNSFLTLNEKKEIIEWYKNFFEEKLDTITKALEDEEIEQEYFRKK